MNSDGVQVIAICLFAGAAGRVDDGQPNRRSAVDPLRPVRAGVEVRRDSHFLNALDGNILQRLKRQEQSKSNWR